MLNNRKGVIMKKLLVLGILVLFVSAVFTLESDPSDVVGYVKYGCVTNALGDFNLMAVSLDAGYTVASEVGVDYPAIQSIKHWDNVGQVWVASDNFGTFWWPDNAVSIAQPYYVNVSADTVWPVIVRETSPFSSPSKVKK